VLHVILFAMTPFAHYSCRPHPREVLNAQERRMFTQNACWRRRDNASPEAKQVIANLLSVNPRGRPSPSECLSMNWFRPSSPQRVFSPFSLSLFAPVCSNSSLNETQTHFLTPHHHAEAPEYSIATLQTLTCTLIETARPADLETENQNSLHIQPCDEPTLIDNARSPPRADSPTVSNGLSRMSECVSASMAASVPSLNCVVTALMPNACTPGQCHTPNCILKATTPSGPEAHCT
jgi:serine/threonine protein kinase